MAVDVSDRWSDLATYNAERSRGLLHSHEWQERMAAEQDAFYAEVKARWDALPRPLAAGPVFPDSVRIVASPRRRWRRLRPR